MVPTVFVSFSAADRDWKARIVKQLRPLERQGLLKVRDERLLLAGDEWRHAFTRAIDQASLALLLVSADFLATPFVRDAQVPHLLERRQAEGLRVYPVVVEPCAWQSVDWLAPLAVRPRHRPCLSAGTPHEVQSDLADIAREVQALLSAPAASEHAATGPRRARGGHMGHDTQVTILFLAANPGQSPRLALDEEARDIEAKIRAAEHRDTLRLRTRWAVRADDVIQALLEDRPRIVHFSGHGSRDGIALQGDDGLPRPASGQALHAVLAALGDVVRVAVLNACWTAEHAEALATAVDCVVGMEGNVGDEAARVFAASFYRALGFGRSVGSAFDLGRAAVLLQGLPDECLPRLLARPGIDADRVFVLEDVRP